MDRASIAEGGRVVADLYAARPGGRSHVEPPHTEQLPRQSGQAAPKLLGFADRIANLLTDVAEFRDRNVFEPFPFAIELFIDLHGGFLHHGMRIVAAADEEEVLATSQPGVAVVVIQPEPQKGG